MLFSAWLFALVFAYGQCQCYLEDASATCSVCWVTSHGVTTVSICPAGIVIEWEKPVPHTIEGETDYTVEYVLSLDTSLVGFQIQPKMDKGVLYEVPHANIHSCIRSRGACTPFVANSPGLSTHTSSTPGNFSRSGNMAMFRQKAKLKLAIESYMIIAHTRFFVSCQPSCEEKYDVVVGIPRDVLMKALSTSTDAYISAALTGTLIVVGLASVMWASRTGRIDFESIVTALTREEVVYMSSIIIAAGDVITFTIGVKHDVIDREEMQNSVPICIVFLVVGWIATLICIWQSCKSLYDVLDSHANSESSSYWGNKSKRRSLQDMAREASLNDNTDETNCKMSSSATVKRAYKAATMLDLLELVGDEKAQTIGYVISSSPEARTFFREYYQIKRSLRQCYIHIIAILLAHGPMVAIGVYILAKTDSPDIIVIIALVGNTFQLGCKASEVSHFSRHLQELETTRNKLKTAICGDIHKKSESRTDETCECPPEGSLHSCCDGIVLEHSKLDIESADEPLRTCADSVHEDADKPNIGTATLAGLEGDPKLLHCNTAESLRPAESLSPWVAFRI